MSSVSISFIVFACVFGGAVLGMFLNRTLPEPHLSADSKGTVNLGVGLIGTMAALVLGLVVSEAAGSYFAQRDELTQVSAKLVLLDRVLSYYGPEALQARHDLRGYVAETLAEIWPQESSRGSWVAPSASGTETFHRDIAQLSPQNDNQRSLKGDAANIAIDISKTRWLMFEQESFPVPAKFLAVVVLWLTVVFASFGLYAPRNATVIVTLFLCAVSVAGAILLIVELYKPFHGPLQISSAPLRSALAQLGK
jgi:hypothetical protein